MKNYLYQPLLILPDLIEQPTWGGDYIVKYKGWDKKPEYLGKKIGQSYELHGKIKMLVDDKEIYLNDFITINPNAVLGKSIYQRFGKMPLLIKFTQALGNSFQLHIKSGVKHSHWQPKPESWYFFEPGYVTCGIKSNTRLGDYKKTCVEIDMKMKQLSQQVINKKVDIREARSISKKLVKELYPWQFVNVGEIKKDNIIDLSSGAIHHSWEENVETCPEGNIVYEVQLDVADVDCTIRSFDQGKINNNGSIRQLNIDDYFNFIDIDMKNNSFSRLVEQSQNNQVFNTDYYCLDKIMIDKKTIDCTNDSFVHLFVKEGMVDVITKGGQIGLSKGHSCFLPAIVKKYQIINQHNTISTILKTYINN